MSSDGASPTAGHGAHVSLREHAQRILDAAIAAADPRAAVRNALRLEGGVLAVADEERVALEGGRVWVIGAGKAAVGMALGARDVLGERISGGTVTTRDGYGGEVPGIYLWEAAHPVPDTRGLAAAADALACARAAGERVVVL